MVGVGKSEFWRYSPDYGAIFIVIESESFDEVPEGERIPECDSITVEVKREEIQEEELIRPEIIKIEGKAFAVE